MVSTRMPCEFLRPWAMSKMTLSTVDLAISRFGRRPPLGDEGVDAGANRHQRHHAEHGGRQARAPGEPVGGVALDLRLAQLRRLQRPPLLLLLRQPLLLGGIGLRG